MSAQSLLSQIPATQADPAALSSLLQQLAESLRDDANTQQLGRSFAAELTPTLMGQVQNRDVVLPLVQALWRGLAGIRPTSCGTVKRFGPSETIVDWPTRPQEPMFNTEIMRADPARRESMGNAPLARGEYVMLAVGEERADARKINLTTLNGVAQTGLITALVRALQTHRQDPVIVEHAACALGRCAFAGASEGGQARSIELATAGGTAILSQLLVEHVGQGNTTAVSGLLQALSSAMSGADVGMPMTQGQKDILLQTGAANSLMQVVTSQWVDTQTLFNATGALANWANESGWSAHGQFQVWSQSQGLATRLMGQFQGNLHQPPILEATSVAMVHVGGSDVMTCRALAGSGVVQLAMNAMYMYQDSTRLVRVLGGMSAAISNKIFTSGDCPEKTSVINAMPTSLPIVLNAFEHNMWNRDLVSVLAGMTLISLIQIMEEHAKEVLTSNAHRIAAIASQVLRQHARSMDTSDHDGLKSLNQTVFGCVVALGGLFNVDATDALAQAVERDHIDVDIAYCLVKLRELEKLDAQTDGHTSKVLQVLRPFAKLVLDVSMVRMTQHDVSGRVYLKLKSSGGNYKSEAQNAENLMSMSCKLQVPVKPAVADKELDKAASHEATMASLAAKLAGMPGKPTQHIAQVAQMAKDGDATVELSLRKKTTFGRQTLASASLSVAELLQAQQEPVGVELTSNGTPVAIVHVSATGLEPLGSEPYVGGIDQCRIVPITKAAYRRASVAAAAKEKADLDSDSDSEGEEDVAAGKADVADAPTAPSGPFELHLNILQTQNYEAIQHTVEVEGSSNVGRLVELAQKAHPGAFPAGHTVGIVSAGQALDGEQTIADCHIAPNSVITLVVRVPE